MKTKLSLLAGSIMLATQVQATSASYSWEDNSTILGSFSASHLEHTNDSEQALTGTFALKVNDIDPVDNSTPQSFVGWVFGLSDGDTVTASFWVYDESDERPAGRIWGHYTDDNTDIGSYAGSASGNSSYTDRSGWQQLSHTWTFDSEAGSRDALVIEFRLYDSKDYTTGSVWLDDLEIISTSGTIVLPSGETVTNGDNDGDDGDDSGTDNSSELIISEYIEGSSNNKAIEIYNSGAEAIDLATEGYQLARYSNGGTNASTVNLDGKVAAGDVFVIANSASVQAILDVADQVSGSINHNGDDAWELLKNGVGIDSFGQIGNDPGSYWGNGNTATQNNTLRRIDLTPDTIGTDAFDPQAQWSGHGNDNFDDLGSFNGSNGGDNGDGDDNGGGGDSDDSNLVCNAPYTTINAIQGNGSTTPLSGNQVEVEAIVTADFQTALSGFYAQSLASDVDSDPQTSEGIFVYTGNNLINLNVGDRVRLAATAAEYNDMTQLSSITASLVCDSGNTLPETSPFVLPLSTEADAEALEGMLVSFNGLTVNDTYNLLRYGSVTLANGRRMIPTQVALPGTAADAIAAQNQLNQVVLDDGSNQQNPTVVAYPETGLSANNTLRVGDTISMSEGVLHYSFGDFRIHPLTNITTNPVNPRSVAPELDVEGNLKVASYNVLNYFKTLNQRGADNAVEFQRQKDKIVAALSGLDADVIGLMEIENDGFGIDSSIYDLVAALNVAVPGTEWQFITPEVDTIGTDAIAVGILYRSNVVTPNGAAKILDSNNSILGEDNKPLFIDNKNRPTLAQSFILNENGEDFVVAVNHLKSKGSDCDKIGDPDLGDGQGNCNLTRTKAAQAVSAWLNAEYVDQPILVIGDLNAYAKEDPIMAFNTAGFAELFETLNIEDAYSYIFRGESGQLDHALANAQMTESVLDVTEWHINADEPRALDYNTEFKSDAQINSFYAADAYRSSDHDPVVVTIDLEAPFDPNLTDVAAISVVGLSDKSLQQFAAKQLKWESKITKWAGKIAKLQTQIESLKSDVNAEKIASKQARITQLTAKSAVYADLIEVLSLATSAGNDTLIAVARQVDLNDKNEERLLRKEIRFEQRAQSEKATQLEARAAELAAQGKVEKAQRKLEKAAHLRARSAVFAQLMEVLAAAL